MLALANCGSGSSHLEVSTEGLDDEVIRSLLTTLSGNHRNSVVTGRNRNRGSGVTRAPHEDTRNIRLSGQGGGGVLTEDIHTSDRDLTRSSGNRDGHRLRSQSRFAVLIVDSLSSEGVVASLVEVDSQSSLVLTSNLDTILVPNVAVSVARSIEGDLVTLADGRLRSGHNNLSRTRGDNDGHFALSGARTVRRGNRSSHSVSSGLSGLDVNRGGRVASGPQVSNIALPAFLINIQSGVLTLANCGSRSAHLKVSTEGGNIEVLRSQLTTFSGVHRDIVRTGRNVDGGSGVTRAPHEDTRNIRLSGQGGGGVFTEDIHTSDRNLTRSRGNRDGHRLRSLSGNTTLNADSLSGEGVLTSLVEVHSNSILVLTSDLDTILVPNVSGNLRIDRSGEGDLHTLANRVGRSNNVESSGQFVNDDRHFTLSGTRTVGGVNRSGHMISGSRFRLDINRGSNAAVSLSIPLIRDIALPAFLINIQSGVFTLADAGSGSANEQVSTEGGNCERCGGHLATLNSLHRHSVNTSRDNDALSVLASGPSPFALNIRVSSQNSGVILTKDIVTADFNSARSRVDNNLTSHSRNFRDTTGSRERNHNRVVISGNVVGGGEDVLAEGSASSTFDQATISVPSEDGLTNRTVSIVGSSNRNLCAVANSVRSNTIHSDIGDDRNLVHGDGHLVVSDTSGVGLEYHNTQSGGLIQVGSIGRQGSTGDVVTIINVRGIIDVGVVNIVTNLRDDLLSSDFVPLIDQVLSVVVVQVSRQSDLTVGANHRL